MFPPETMFERAEELLRATAHNLMIGQGVPVPKCDICQIGFSCKSFSSLNNERHTFADAISSVKGTSGQTAAMALAYVERARPLIVLLETKQGCAQDTRTKTWTIIPRTQGATWLPF